MKKKTELRRVLEQIEDLARSVGDEEEGRGAGDGEVATTRRGGRLTARKGDVDVHSTKSEVHKFGRNFVCRTNSRGHATPGGRSPTELVLDASEGFVPLWEHGVTLRWQFNQASLEPFLHPAELKEYVRDLMRDAILAWDYAAPVSFVEREDAWDFEIVIRAQDDCDAFGCTLASAFFPDAGRHELVIYPEMFDQDHDEQVETLVHEIGHVFGLRHFFADVSETAWPSEIFGEHKAFSIMNYGAKSVLTETDKSDLRLLYDLVWTGELTDVNKTPIRLVKPYHASGEAVTPSCESRLAALRRRG
ncbi:MAG: matrixin family metalloprotease [Myxococcota bacterium]